jgi:hypothetical protein
MTFEEWEKWAERQRERHEALAESVEILGHELETLRATAEAQTKSIELLMINSQKDAENIRALARIAEIHEHRITRLEGGE